MHRGPPSVEAPVALGVPSSAIGSVEAPVALGVPSSTIGSLEAPVALGVPSSAIGSVEAPVALGVPSSTIGSLEAPVALGVPSSVIGSVEAPVALGVPSSVIGSVEAPVAVGVPSSVIGSVEAPVALGVPSSVIAGIGSVEVPESLGEPSSTPACGTVSGSSCAGGAILTRRMRTVGSFAAGLLSPSERRFLLQGVPVARLSAAPCPRSASSDEEAGASLISPRGGNRLLLREACVKAPLSHGAPHTSARVVVGCLVHLYTRQA